jgi:hypothetical protein
VYTPAVVEAGTVTVNVAVPEVLVRTDDGVTEIPAGTTRRAIRISDIGVPDPSTATTVQLAEVP